MKKYIPATFGITFVVVALLALSTTTLIATASQGACGNGKKDSGEQCGEPHLNCKAGYNCSNCKCVEKTPLCGNGVKDTGEECNEPGLKCKTGYDCKSCKCVEKTPLCGNGVKDSGEQCGEKGLSCKKGLICNACKCETEKQPYCGNGIKDSNEKCGEPGLKCNTGYYCSYCLCNRYQCMSCDSNCCSVIKNAGCRNFTFTSARVLPQKDSATGNSVCYCSFGNTCSVQVDIPPQ